MHAGLAAQANRPAFLNVVEFWPDWYPNLHEAFEWPRVQTLHFLGSFWPHDAGFNRLNVEPPISEEVLKELQARGHNANGIRALGKNESSGAAAGR